MKSITKSQNGMAGLIILETKETSLDFLSS